MRDVKGVMLLFHNFAVCSCVCLYVCMYACIYVCMYMFVRVCIKIPFAKSENRAVEKEQSGRCSTALSRSKYTHAMEISDLARLY